LKLVRSSISEKKQDLTVDIAENSYQKARNAFSYEKDFEDIRFKNIMTEWIHKVKMMIPLLNLQSEKLGCHQGYYEEQKIQTVQEKMNKMNLGVHLD
jgi:histidinol phosphatase-like enzyme